MEEDTSRNFKFNNFGSELEIEIEEEITINYAPTSLFMKNLQTRQTALSKFCGFKCSCNICVDESQNNADGLYEEFAKLRQEFPSSEGRDSYGYIRT